MNRPPSSFSMLLSRRTRRRTFIAALGGVAAGSVGAGASGAGGRVPQRNATWAGDAGPTGDAGSVVDRWVTAFNSNDVDALVNLYAVDAILLGSTGLILLEGNEAIRGYFARLANSGDKVAIGDRKIIVLDDNVSYATGFYEFSAVQNGEVKKSWAGFSIVLAKHTNDWLIAHHHSSERSSPSPPTIAKNLVRVAATAVRRARFSLRRLFFQNA